MNVLKLIYPKYLIVILNGVKNPNSCQERLYRNRKEAAAGHFRKPLNKSVTRDVYTYPSFLRRQEPKTLRTEVPACAGTTGEGASVQ